MVLAKHYKENGSKKKNIEQDNSKTKRSKKLKIFLIILRTIFIAIIIVSSIYIIRWNNDNKANAELTEHLYQYVSVNYEEPKDTKINYDKLKQENENYYAWLIVNGTGINYPVVHYTNNDYYLNHAFDNTYNEAGCPFADSSAKCDGTDKNLVIYAHNRRDRKYVCIIEKYT